MKLSLNYEHSDNRDSSELESFFIVIRVLGAGPRTGPGLEILETGRCRGRGESLAQSTGLLDIWKGRCWERAGIVIEN